MALIRKLARKLLGASFEINDLEIVFHKGANQYGTHGTIRATNLDQRLNDANVRFAFVGLTVPPPLTPAIFNYIWEEARAHGYMPHELTKYGMILPTDEVDSLKVLVSAARKQAESTAMLAKPQQAA